ncbi:MAG: replication restart helicase PriA [Lachnospiraceae bacterium]
MEYRFARIIIDISHELVDRPFTYKIPDRFEKDVVVGSKVTIPFGKGNTIRSGFVIEVTNECEFEIEKVKEINDVEDNGIVVEQNLIKLAWFIKEEYGSTMITALKTVLPAKKTIQSKEQKVVHLKIEKEQAISILEEATRKNQKARVRILNSLLEKQSISYETVKYTLKIGQSTLTKLIDDGIIYIETKYFLRNPILGDKSYETNNVLSLKQRHIVDTIFREYVNEKPNTYLLHGITGSGKTQVYISLIESFVKAGKQAIVLIPEIALTYQTVQRFYQIFKERVSILNSTLSQGEKYDQCERAKRGEIDVIIGPRSALFTPFANLGIIIIDEEHESSYKSESMPKYHAKDVAIQLAKLHHASVVLGSATPSLESYYKAKNGEYQLFHLANRLTGSALPRVQIVDLRQELLQGNRSIFSEELKLKIRDRLQKKEQIMLFLNRRGYAGFISCRACGYVVKCPHCDVSLSEHQNGKLICHYCAYEQQKYEKCPKCDSKYILGFKAGTQQIVDAFCKEFQVDNILRLDADTTKHKGSYEKIVTAFKREEAQVLVGTQMIVKGHDFPKVTLVGVLAADLSLNSNDYRAGERTFQLLTQAAGRAGRGDEDGEVIIQTYQPDHYSILASAKQNYEAFYEEELLFRELSGYPPIEHMLLIQITNKEEESVCKDASFLRTYIESLQYIKITSLIGPAKARIYKIKDIYRMALYVKAQEKERLIQIKNEIEEIMRKNEGIKSTIQFDFDPMSSY